MKNSAIILAGGNGSRMRTDIPKQFITINNRMIIDYSINKFFKNKNINEIIIVCAKEWINQIKNKYPDIKVVLGGGDRSKSSFAGLMACNSKTENVLIHDAARPLININIINKSFKSLKKYDATIPTLGCDDSLLDYTTMQYINRKSVKKIQTPQGFKYKIILDAYKQHRSLKLKRQNIFKDDLSLLLNYYPNIKYFLYNGDKLNFKITHKEDILKFKNLL